MLLKVRQNFYELVKLFPTQTNSTFDILIIEKYCVIVNTFFEKICQYDIIKVYI